MGPEVQGTLRPIGCQVQRAWYLPGPTPLHGHIPPWPCLEAGLMGGSGVPMWHGGVEVFGEMQEMELSVSFSRTVWDGTPFLALSTLSQGPRCWALGFAQPSPRLLGVGHGCA